MSNFIFCNFFCKFLIFNDVLVSSTLTLSVNIFTWKKEKQCSPGATKFFFLNKKKIKIKNSFTRKMFRILTKRILTCLFKKKRGGGVFSILVQNIPKVTKKGARSCSLTKKLLKILKVAKKLPSRIWKGLSVGSN